MKRAKKKKSKFKFKRIKLSAERQLFLIIILMILLIVLVISTRTCAQQQAAMPSIATDKLELPIVENYDFVINNTEGRYIIYYDTAYRQAAWVAYILTRDDVSAKGAERKNRFIADPEIESRGWPYSTNGDYSKTGYDKGHLLPSADRDNTQTENDATFLLSNISPQRPGLNRKTWNSLENMVRQVAARYDTTYIVTGIIKGSNDQRIGKHKVAVPAKFYKTLLFKKDGSYVAVAFVIPNSDDLLQDFRSYAITVDSLEKLSNHDFFHNLPDQLEEIVEKTLPSNLIK